MVFSSIRHLVAVHQQVCHISAEKTLIHLVYLRLLAVVRCVDIKVQGGHLGIVALHLCLGIDHEVVSDHRQELQGIDLLAIEAHVDMKNVIADGDIVAGLDVLAEIADGLLDVEYVTS